MSRYFSEMRAVLERHSGTVEKYIGDAVMAIFGVPALHEDDALRAVRAAAEMRDALPILNRELERTWGVPLAIRIGVNTGEVVVSDPSACQLLATGAAVTVAKRLDENRQIVSPRDIKVSVEKLALGHARPRFARPSRPEAR